LQNQNTLDDDVSTEHIFAVPSIKKLNNKRYTRKYELNYGNIREDMACS
jgi:hypothetical protein